jgi:guanine deaminase
MGRRLLDWLREETLPAEQRFADAALAREQARTFVRLLLRNGTTAALVFGSQFPAAEEALFDAAEAAGLSLTSGLTLSDEGQPPALLQTPERAWHECDRLARAWHGRGRLRYAVTPRFAVSCSPALLEVCGALLDRHPGLFLQTHLNETIDEIEAVRHGFPWAADYLAVYERFALVGPRSVFAHNLYPTDGELERLAAAGAAVAHCPTSNAFLGSGLFPLRRHLEHGARVALGSDVGAGTGLCLLDQGLGAYAAQMLQPGSHPLSPAQILYLTTRAGAEALDLSHECGDFGVGKRADLVLVRPIVGSTLAAVLRQRRSAEAVLGAVFTLGGEGDIAAVYLGGDAVVERAG